MSEDNAIPMPKLEPLPIKTKKKKFWKQIRIWFFESRRWRVIEDWEYTHEGEVFIIPKGFVFDGASIPKTFWNILSPVGLLFIPGLIHDFAYRYDYMWVKDSNGIISKKYEGKGQEYWDDLFYKIAKNVNGMKIVNKPAWFLLSLFGCKAWNENRERNEDDLFPEGYLSQK